MKSLKSAFLTFQQNLVSFAKNSADLPNTITKTQNSYELNIRAGYTPHIGKHEIQITFVEISHLED
jgi:hypothetical protein